MAGIPVALGSPAQLALPALALAMAVFCTCQGKDITGEGEGFPGSDLMQLGIAGGRQASSGCKSLPFSCRMRILLPQVVPGRKVMWESLLRRCHRIFAWQSRMGQGFSLRSCMVTAGSGLQLPLPSSS